VVRPWRLYTIERENLITADARRELAAQPHLSLAPQSSICIGNAAMLHYLINFFYPPRCAACDARMGSGATRRVCAACHAQIDRMPEDVCETCGVPVPAKASLAATTDGQEADDGEASDDGQGAKKVRWCASCVSSPPHFTRARAVVRYGQRPSNDDRDVVPSIIRRHKYGLDQSLTHALAECLGDELPLGEADYDLVMPVPLHRGRLRWRGFNQAAMLAATVARRIGRPIDLKTLVRVRATPPQTLQKRVERVRNLKRAFAVRRPWRVASRRILLIDDVMTTGATADECARMLIAAGARRVDVLTLARAT
jgi:ComF family protein